MPEKEAVDSKSAIGAGAGAEGIERTVEELPAILEPSVPTESDQHRSSTPLPPTSMESSLDSPEDATRIDPEVVQNISAWLNGPADVEEVVVNQEQLDNSAVHQDTPQQPAVEAPIASGSTPESSPAVEGDPSNAPQTPGRSFPPPGTLVVVQGVVHTTDVPPRLPSNDAQDAARRSSSTPPNPSGRRNRLSALLHSRPSSMIAPRPPSAVDTSSLAPPASTASDPATSSSHNLPGSSNDSQSNSTSPLENTDAPVQEGSNPPAEAAPPAAEEPGTISSSSIDILGTLLSVAAAATAASLLTGSSEPIMSSGLAPPAYNPDGTVPNPLPADPWLSQPTSPTPTAGLGMGMNPDNTRSERLRSAWGNIRERLGLRPSPAPASPLGSNGEPNTPSILAANDPREVMMAQMARAFNLGFGMGSGDGMGSSENGGAEENREIAMPPEGSFERFLIDLQADLRVALTSPGGLSGDAGNIPEQQQQQPTAPTENITSTSSNASTHSHTNSPRQVFTAPIVDDNDTEDDDMPESGAVSDSESEAEFLDAHMPSLEPVDASMLGTNAGPARAAQAPLDNDNSRSGEDGTEATTSERGAAGPADASPSNTQPSGTAPRRINWWRLYRFPPITAPRTHHATGVTTATPSSFDMNTFSTTPASSLNSDPASPLPEMDTTLAELPFANADEADEPPPQRLHMVVPVIVVGLQSVNTTIMQQHTGATDDGEGSSDGEGEEELDVEEGNSSSRLGGEQGRNTAAGRGRPWHTRAADAIRNLRPGRRNRAMPAAVLPGRTFLIYVIGGYYPPDHSIVTGGPSSLDSFEALLELAELLGQVKPPTVSKEDIEKSGLEVIKPSQVEQYEKENKIASNCTERCLICLDDYQPEDEIRLMTCRHGFHKGCVDKWLETGRNNCPACRSKGVSLETPLSTPAL